MDEDSQNYKHVWLFQNTSCQRHPSWSLPFLLCSKIFLKSMNAHCYQQARKKGARTYHHQRCESWVLWALASDWTPPASLPPWCDILACVQCDDLAQTTGSFHHLWCWRTTRTKTHTNKRSALHQWLSKFKKKKGSFIDLSEKLTCYAFTMRNKCKSCDFIQILFNKHYNTRIFLFLCWCKISFVSELYLQ